MRIIKFKAPKEQTKHWIPLDKSKVKYIVIHHTAHPTAGAEEVNQWHLSNGWKGGIGYNEMILKDGTAVICRDSNIGAQTAGYNSKSYGIALQGDLSKEGKLPNEQLYCLIMRVLDAMKRHNLKADSIKLHKELNNTDCPGKFDKSKLLKGVAEYASKI